MKTEPEIKATAESLLAEQTELMTLEQQLAQNPLFAEWLDKQKEFAEKSADTWKAIEQAMIDNKIEKISLPDKRYIRINEKLVVKADADQLPDEYKKVVADTKKIGDDYKLTGDLPTGASASYTKYLTKKI